MGKAIDLLTPRTTLRCVLAVMSCYRVTTACVSSPTNWAVSIGSHMQQNKFSLFSATSRRNIGDDFLLITIVQHVFLNESLRFWVASSGNSAFLCRDTL